MISISDLKYQDSKFATAVDVVIGSWNIFKSLSNQGTVTNTSGFCSKIREEITNFVSWCRTIFVKERIRKSDYDFTEDIWKNFLFRKAKKCDMMDILAFFSNTEIRFPKSYSNQNIQSRFNS